MHVLLIDTNERMIAAWRMFFHGQPQVTLLQGDLTQVTADAIVSPANSFGFMDGGVDYAISERLGWDLQEKLQARIHALPMGELLVGQALVMETGDELIPHLICAPTMRVPTNYHIGTSVNAYLAMKAALVAAQGHPDWAHIAVPGFCTGVGRMMPEVSARQMWLAYEEVVLGRKPRHATFGDAQKHHWKINPQGQIWE